MSFSVERFDFREESLAEHERTQVMLQNWPVVYVLNNRSDVYVGESLSASLRMRQHLASASKANFQVVRVILEETFNKSVCLDLESHLIRWFSGDGVYQIRNRNDGVTNSNYYRRSEYRETFEDIFESLRTSEHLFTRTVPQIENTELFKYSPFKSLSHDQAIAVEDILEGLFADLEEKAQEIRVLQDTESLPTSSFGEVGSNQVSVIQGSAGTGKTIVAVYLLKLLCDIRDHDPADVMDADSVFSDFYARGHAEHLQGMRLGMVVPQQSLRKTIQRVFKQISGMWDIQVMTPFEVGGRGGRLRPAHRRRGTSPEPARESGIRNHEHEIRGHQRNPLRGGPDVVHAIGLDPREESVQPPDARPDPDRSPCGSSGGDH